MKVFSYTQPREAILEHRRWYLRQGAEWVAADVSEGKRHGKSVIARLAGVDDRDAAVLRVGCDIAVARKDLPETEEGTYYWTDLEGMKVVNRDGTELGTVAYLMETGANDVMVTEGERERLIPFIKNTVILDVDLANNVISVDWEWD